MRSRCRIWNGKLSVPSTIAYAPGFVYRYSFYHYRIDRLLNGNVTLSGSRAQEKFALSNNDTKPNNSRTSTIESDQMEFPGPMDLINHFQKKADLLVTTLAIPCQRPYVSVIFLSRKAPDDSVSFAWRIIILFNSGVHLFWHQNCTSTRFSNRRQAPTSR